MKRRSLRGLVPVVLLLAATARGGDGAGSVPGAPASPATVPARADTQAVRPSPGVHVALMPAAQTVAPGAEFDVSLEVTRAGAAFNAFDAIVGFDPAALTLVPQTPVAQQEGDYFGGACGTHFHRFRAGADRDTITDVLLCAGKSLTGPGQIYKLRFRASSTAQRTMVRVLPGLMFYNAGLFVRPDSSTDAVVGIGVPAADSASARVPAGKRPVKSRAAARRPAPSSGAPGGR